MDETKCYIKAEDALTNGCPNKRVRVSRFGRFADGTAHPLTCRAL